MTDVYYSEGFTLRYVNGQAHGFVIGYNPNHVYEYVIPTPSMTAPYPEAQIFKDWGYVSGNKAVAPDFPWFRGIFWDEVDKRLYWTYSTRYDVPVDNPSVGYSTLNDATGVATPYGAWRFKDLGNKVTNSCVISLPAWFSSLPGIGGKRLGVGCGGYQSPGHSTSMGPALAAINPPNPTVNPELSSLEYTSLVGYMGFLSPDYTAPWRAQRNTDYNNTWTGWNPKDGMGYWGPNDKPGAAVWIDLPTKTGLFYFPTMNKGRAWYYNASTCSQLATHWWSEYDPADLAAVAQGTKQQDQIQAVYSWPVSYPNFGYITEGQAAGSSTRGVNGAAFDPTTQRLYVSVGASYGNNGQALIHVYEVGDNIAPPAPPVSSPPQIIFSAVPTSLPDIPTGNGEGSIDETWLSWYVDDATSVRIDPGVGPVLKEDTLVVKLDKTTTYTITATNAFGTKTSEVTVSVNNSPPPVCGNNKCETGETLESCPADCTPPPTGLPPSVTTHPQSASVPAGQPVTFKVIAQGTAPLTYEWQVKPVGAADFFTVHTSANASFTFSNPQASDNGSQFRVKVINSLNTAISNPATLTVFGSAITIIQQPSNQTVTAGQTAVFNVTATGSSPTYQWQFKAPGGTTFENIPNANGSSYITIPTTLAHNNTRFRVIVGQVISSEANLTVTTAVVPPSIIQNPKDQSVTAGQNASFNVTVGGSSPFIYVWQFKAPGSSTFNDIPGATDSLYTAASVTTAMNGTRYRVKITNSAGSIISGEAALTVNTALIAPSIQVQPQSTNVNVNQNANFQVLASGSNPLNYQWQKKSPGGSSFADIPGATTSSFTQFNAQLNQSGTQFQCVISNVVKSVTTNPATMTVTPPGTGPAQLNLLVPINGATVTGTLVTAAYYSTGDLSHAHHVQLQLDDMAPVQGQSLNGVYTFTNIPSGTHLLTISLATADGTSIPGTTTAVTFTTSLKGNEALPKPNLNLPDYVSVDGNLSASYPSGYGGVGFAWTITPANGSPGASSNAKKSVAIPTSTANFQTTSNIAGLRSHALSPGYYRVTVQGVDALGNASEAAEDFVTLVTANFSNTRVYPNPWRANQPGSNSIIFDRLPLESTVKIFTVSGHWIKSLSAVIDKATWDLTNDKGDKAASGIYVYVIKAGDGGEKKTGQVHVIR